VVVRLTARTACPLVVVRPTLGYPGAPFAGHVVVGVDGSSAARAALQFGYRYAARHRMPIAAVHVTSESAGDLWFDECILETHFAVEPPALAMLANQIGVLGRRDPDIVIKRAMYGGETAEALLRASAGAALLVVGRADGGVAPYFRAGSVREALAYHAGCTLAVVPTVPS
jgi:nucleotide-binding universal stress UspA family protein